MVPAEVTTHLADDFVAAIRSSTGAGIATDCLRTVLAAQPRLALRDDISEMLAPALWVDELLDIVQDPAERRILLDRAQPAFQAYAIAKLSEAGASLDGDAALLFVAAIRECSDGGLITECLKQVLPRQPVLALMGHVAAMLTPDMWADELLELMRTPEEQVALLALSQQDFRVFAVQKLIEASVDLDIGILTLCPLRSCPALLEQVQWSIDDVSYAKAVGQWLEEACLCDGEGRKLVVSAAERMHATGDLMSPTMWAHLP